MDFSGEFHSIFPLSSLFYPRNLRLSSPLPPFTPVSPPLTLLSCPSLLPHFIPSTSPSLHFYTLHSYLQPELPCAAHTIPALHPSSPRPHTNLLLSLPSCLPNTFHLFFPTGENAHAIAFLSVTSQSDSATPYHLTLDSTGDVFKQTKGLRHPSHRISSLSVSPCSASEVGLATSLAGDRVFEGFLLATTLYAVSWFRVETGPFQVQVDGEEKQRPFLVPLATHGFEKPVVHACFSPHMKEECAVLLENGELHLFNLCLKQSGRVVARCGKNPGQYISCEYSAEPCSIIVVCSNAIMLVNLLNPDVEHTRILFQPQKLGSYDMNLMEDRKEKFLVSCRSNYNYYHLAVLTKYRLLLLDMRQPMHPILTWEHGLDGPNYVTMLTLKELNPSIGNNPIQGSGFSILAGSLSTDEFKLFHYGSIHKQDASCASSIVAWGLPSGIFLSGQCTGTSNQLLDEYFSGKCPIVKDNSWLRKQEMVVGFLVIPLGNSLIKPGLNGFNLIRLMSFGRLEVQNYDLSNNMQDKELCTKEGVLSHDMLTACADCKRETVPTRHNVFDLRYFDAYIHGDLSKTLPMDNRQSCNVPLSANLLALMHDSINYTPSLSPFIDNATVPSSIVEIAYMSALDGLKPDLIPLAFAKYSDIFPSQKNSNFQLLSVSRSSSGGQGPLLVTKPYRRGQKWYKKSKAPRDKLVGPILPVPVLLTLQERERNGNNFLLQGDGTIVNQKCTEVHDKIFPADLGADTEETSETKSFFIYEPQCNIKRSKELERRDEKGFRDGNYETFVSGLNTRPSCDQLKSDPDTPGPELFDVGPIRMDFDLKKEVGQIEKEELQKRKGQLSNWLNELKPYQEFCRPTKIPKSN